MEPEVVYIAKSYVLVFLYSFITFKDNMYYQARV